MFDNLKKEMPLLGLLLLIFTLFINNMPVDFVININQIFNSIFKNETQKDKKGLNNQKILSVSNIVLFITLSIIIFYLRGHKGQQVNDNGKHSISQFQIYMISLIGVISGLYLVLWGVLHGLGDYGPLKYLKKNDYIKNVIIYDPTYLFLYSGLSVICMGFISLIYYLILNTNIEGHKTYGLYGYFVIFVACIMLLYLRYDGFWDLIKDLTVKKGEQWRKNFKESGIKTIIVPILLIILMGILLWKSGITNIAPIILMVILNCFLIFLNQPIYAFFILTYVAYLLFKKITESFTI